MCVCVSQRETGRDGERGGVMAQVTIKQIRGVNVNDVNNIIILPIN